MCNEKPHWVKESLAYSDDVIFVCSECDSDFPEPHDVCPICKSNMSKEIKDHTDLSNEMECETTPVIFVIIGGYNNVYRS